ncbi:RCBT1-like protein [Mya arenaria]|uniref:RCBT1-like protein n=1 Tax=Mya arenaria TaxID=6604 RepID=A0ABY7EPR1_MYAAR|nr:RCBT1-like protein [Mya arenaria]
MLDVTKWPIFSLLDPNDAAKIAKICVFGSSGNEAIYINNIDDVYSIGSNCSGCLGLGDSHSSLEPRKIDALCRKRIVDIAFGSGPHVLAVSENGEVYSWGHNGYCQLGNGGSTQGIMPILVSTNLQGKRVSKVACGSHHSMALTLEGENNCGQVGSGTTTNQPTPRKVIAVLGSRVAISIACGQTSSMALMEKGEVYGWGYNANGQLGLGNNVNQPNPCRVQMLQNTIVSQIVCGYAHTLALSDEGELFSWGANSYGQLGTGNKANLVTPSRVQADGERFIEVSASHYSHISAAMTETGKVYMWGQSRGQSITSPLLTQFMTTDDVFAAFSTPPVTWRTHSVNQMKGSRVMNCIAHAFDDQITSDVKFKVEGKEICVHKAILKISHVGMKQGKNQLDLLPEEAIGLLDLANSYCEPILKRKCEQIIRHGISVHNVAMLYAAAIKYEAKELEDFCFRFALNHMTAVTQTRAFEELDETTLKEFIRKAGQAGAFRY